MTRKNIIHRATETFGVAYYSFLALYALYEFIFSAAYLSIVVIAPLFYALVFYAGSCILISLLYVHESRLVTRKQKNLLEEARSYVELAIVSILAAVGLVVEFSSREKPQNLFGGYSLIFVIFTVIEILLHTSVSYAPQKEKEVGFSERLDRILSAYPTGAITFLGIFFGFWLINTLSAPPGNLFTEEAVTAIAFYFLIFFFYIDWLNKNALRWWKRQQPYQRSSLSSKLNF